MTSNFIKHQFSCWSRLVGPTSWTAGLECFDGSPECLEPMSCRDRAKACKRCIHWFGGEWHGHDKTVEFASMICWKQVDIILPHLDTQKNTRRYKTAGQASADSKIIFLKLGFDHNLNQNGLFVCCFRFLQITFQTVRVG